ncbi:MAG: tol-pal system protein YbgF [Longimicrobiales bacterium]
MRADNVRTMAFAAALAIAAGAGCATKGDIRTLQGEIQALRARQDSLFNETQRQTRLLLDTLRTSFAIQQDVRGETSHRFQQLEENLAQLEEMINQSQIMTSQLLDRLERTGAGQPGGVAGAGGEDLPITGEPEAEQMYAAAMQKIGERAYATARAALMQIVENYPNDPRAPYAQVQIAETYYAEGNYELAIVEFEKVEQQWHNSPPAADALLRGGVVAQERDQTEKARELFRAVIDRFPASEAAVEARQRLSELGG